MNAQYAAQVLGQPPVRMAFVDHDELVVLFYGHIILRCTLVIKQRYVIWLFEHTGFLVEHGTTLMLLLCHQLICANSVEIRETVVIVVACVTVVRVVIVDHLHQIAVVQVGCSSIAHGQYWIAAVCSIRIMPIVYAFSVRVQTRIEFVCRFAIAFESTFVAFVRWTYIAHVFKFNQGDVVLLRFVFISVFFF